MKRDEFILNVACIKACLLFGFLAVAGAWHVIAASLAMAATVWWSFRLFDWWGKREERRFIRDMQARKRNRNTS